MQKASTTPQQPEDGKNPQDPCVVFHAFQGLEDLGVSIAGKHGNDARVERLLHSWVLHREADDGQDPEDEREHRQERIVGETCGVVATLASSVSHQHLDRAPRSEAL